MRGSVGRALSDKHNALARGMAGRSFAAHISASPSGPTEAMRSMLVVPGEPSGTPATMMTRWPARAKPSRKAMLPARLTMSSRSCASSATTQCTPQTTDSLRPVARFGVIATTGGFGRSRATRSAVDPELVQQMIADRSSVSAIWRAASAIASPAVGSGSARCADEYAAIGRIALDLLADAVHGRDRLDREFAGCDSADSMMASAPS